MQTGLLFHYEENSIPALSLSFWEELKACYNLDFLLCVDLVGKFLKRKRPLTYSSLYEAIISNPNFHYVYLFQKKSIPEGIINKTLLNFQHPNKNTIYVLGSDSYGINIPVSLINQGTVLTIQIPKGKDNHPMWSSHAATVLLYDRWSKLVQAGETNGYSKN